MAAAASATMSMARATGYPAASAQGGDAVAEKPLTPMPKDSIAGDERPWIAEALANVSEEVRTYNDHLTILASPWMEGRLPGTPGMERAMEYMEYYFHQYGLQAPFPKEVENSDGTIAVQSNASYRQPFRLGAVATVKRAVLEVRGGAGIEQPEFEHGAAKDFTVTTLGSGGSVTAPAVFIGYSIDGGPNGYTSFPDDLDLEGKIAVMLRFEPIGPNGWSQWRNGEEGWTGRTAFTGKIRAAADRGAAGILIVNPPGTQDKRAQQLRPPGGTASSLQNVPVLHMTTEAGERLIAQAFGDRTLEDVRRSADAGQFALPFPGEMHIEAKIEQEQTRAENIVAVLPGKGRLADQYITIGAHLDHLGMGLFGSRDNAQAGKKLHPGADDNASGSAGILLIAQKMAEAYAQHGGDLRSIVFLGFSAEESGLHGSQYYVENPVAPLEKHMLMMNFDMIGRITEKSLSLSGLETGHGLAEFVMPIVERSPLNVVAKGNPKGASDHTKFEGVGMPVLFAIIENFHGDYHTPQDVSSLINRVDAVHAANLFYDIAMAAAERPDTFLFKPGSERPVEESDRARGRTVGPSVRLGVSLSNPSDLVVTGVSPGSTAAEADVRAGDTIVEWNGAPVTDLLALLRASKVGDEVALTVMREGQRVVLESVPLQARGISSTPKSPAKPTAEPQASVAASNSPRAGSRVMFGIRPVYGDTAGGVLAESVTAGSPAAEAGLKAGDRVLSWNGEEIDGARALGGLLGGAKPGDEIQIVIERDGKEMTKKVTLRARGDGS
ncbi:Aminopeptidase S [Planctomycetes bacterium Poly30]|uniref:Aminopeptidase S n=2 Tax=Saltatorellus ferox TaxID=2528018 RepID=A0A518EWT1_9BACT|nr:Aminopeptidase S [Planctomycetes bacterium Poly30]